LPKKLDHFPVNFQIILSTYKLNSQNKDYIFKIKTQSFFLSTYKLNSKNKDYIFKIKT